MTDLRAVLKSWRALSVLDDFRAWRILKSLRILRILDGFGMWTVLKILRGLIGNNVPGTEGTVEFFMGFDKLDMEGGVDLLSSAMVAAVSFRIWAVTQKNTFDGARFDLRVVVPLDENESTATDFAKMR
ncbi:hypothetical protein NEOLEDRAFT_1145453 [Neolentinus lepideus HHB14362 ss-1]|uniref:Uncharacterized protein n=1 Tax=Neolentinus lepideus HHB14362 ss-1 TaxID=1314782 RepID=A0A165V577_9AGAM|nr:hypothetical protein NEOLEDRAFT_1145453 [Neolentinus lepideus HHB14362 ss-1]